MLGCDMNKTFETAFATYTATGSLGNGGSSCVYRVVDEDGNEFAIKELRELSSDKLKRFKNELNYCRSCGIEGIVEVFDYGVSKRDEKKVPFYVMPVYPETMRSHLDDPGKNKEDILYMFLTLIDVLEQMHNGDVYHRDLKPENIMYSKEKDCYILADFGIAHYSADDLATLVETKKDARLANFRYAAPEQREPGMTIDNRADIYSFGLMLNEIFTGEVIHSHGYTKIAQSHSDYAVLDKVVEKMTGQKPIQRYQSFAEVKSEIAQVHAIASNWRKMRKVAEWPETTSQQQVSEMPPRSSPQNRTLNDLMQVQISEVDFRGDDMVFTLNREPNKEWIDFFHENLSGIQDFNYSPRHVEFVYQKAFMPDVDSGDIDRIKSINQRMIQYVEYANKAYESYMAQLHQERQRLKEEERTAMEQAEIRKSHFNALLGYKDGSGFPLGF